MTPTHRRPKPLQTPFLNRIGLEIRYYKTLIPENYLVFYREKKKKKKKKIEKKKKKKKKTPEKNLGGS